MQGSDPISTLLCSKYFSLSYVGLSSTYDTQSKFIKKKSEVFSHFYLAFSMDVKPFYRHEYTLR